MQPATVAALFRHPVKGFSPEPLHEVLLAAGRHFPGDRLFAIENGPSGFDPAAPVHIPKFRFLCLMKNPGLAAYESRYDEATGVFSLSRNGNCLLAADVRSAEGRAAVEAFCLTHLGDALRGPPRFLAAPEGYRFMDSGRSGFVSLLNLASVRDLARRVGRAELDPRRFRMNIWVEGLAPWGEFDLIGRTIEAGGAHLRVLKATERCAATNVDPDRGIADLNLPHALIRELGHSNCGVYAEIVTGGKVRIGDPMAT